MSEILEAGMVILFGVSWPISIHKSYKARTSKGKSPFFLLLIITGYALGIASKIVSDKPVNYVLIFYIINLVTVSIDLALYFRNRALDKAARQ